MGLALVHMWIPMVGSSREYMEQNRIVSLRERKRGHCTLTLISCWLRVGCSLGINGSESTSFYVREVLIQRETQKLIVFMEALER